MDQVLEVLKGLCLLVVALIRLGIGTSGGTQLVKVFLRELSAKPPWLDLSGSRIHSCRSDGVLCYLFSRRPEPIPAIIDGFDAELVQFTNCHPDHDCIQ